MIVDRAWRLDGLIQLYAGYITYTVAKMIGGAVEESDFHEWYMYTFHPLKDAERMGR